LARLDVLMLALLAGGLVAAVGYVYACVHLTGAEKIGSRQP
jgi:hypothetical protein